MTKRRVLVPLDGSESSRQILPHVRRFLDPDGNELILLRVAPPLSITRGPEKPPLVEPLTTMYQSSYDPAVATHSTSIVEVEERVAAALKEELAADVQRLRSAGYVASAAVRFGNPADEIVNLVAAEGVELVAMATHGRTGIGRLVLGSVAERVLHHLTVPVLLVRTSEQAVEARAPGEVLARRLAEGRPARIVVATDGSSCGRVATGFAGKLARALKSKLVVLALAPDERGGATGREILDGALALLGDLPTAPEAIALAGRPDEIVVRELARRPADLFITGACRDRSHERPFAIGLATRRMLQHAPTSALLVKGHEPGFRNMLACLAAGDEVVVEVAARLAAAVGAHLELLHAIPPYAAINFSPRDTSEIPLAELLRQDSAVARYVKGCMEKLEALGLDREAVRIRRGTMPEAVFEEERSGEFDLIVVGYGGGPAHFLGSVADRVVREAHHPVLIVRTAGR